MLRKIFNNKNSEGVFKNSLILILILILFLILIVWFIGREVFLSTYTMESSNVFLNNIGFEGLFILIILSFFIILGLEVLVRYIGLPYILRILLLMISLKPLKELFYIVKNIWYDIEVKGQDSTNIVIYWWIKAKICRIWTIDELDLFYDQYLFSIKTKITESYPDIVVNLKFLKEDRFSVLNGVQTKSQVKERINTLIEQKITDILLSIEKSNSTGIYENTIHFISENIVVISICVFWCIFWGVVLYKNSVNSSNSSATTLTVETDAELLAKIRLPEGIDIKATTIPGFEIPSKACVFDETQKALLLTIRKAIFDLEMESVEDTGKLISVLDDLRYLLNGSFLNVYERTEIIQKKMEIIGLRTENVEKIAAYCAENLHKLHKLFLMEIKNKGV